MISLQNLHFSLPSSVKSFVGNTMKAPSQTAKSSDSIGVSKSASPSTYSGSSLGKIRGRLAKTSILPRSLTGYSAHTHSPTVFTRLSADPKKVVQFNTSHRALSGEGSALQAQYNKALKTNKTSAKLLDDARSTRGEYASLHSEESTGKRLYGDSYRYTEDTHMQRLDDEVDQKQSLFNRHRKELMKAHEAFSTYLQHSDQPA